LESELSDDHFAVSQEELLRLLHSEACDRLRRATVPICVRNAANEIHYNRTGVLLRIGDAYFVLTAFHSLTEYHRLNLALVTQQGNPGEHPVELELGKLVGLSEPADVAAIPVTAHEFQRMGEFREAITLADIDFDPDWDERTPFFLSGYPGELERKVHSGQHVLSDPQLFTLLASGYLGPFANENEFKMKVYVGIRWPTKEFRCWTEGSRGEMVVTPKPHGMSGGGIWRAGWTKVPGKIDGVLLTAIQHSTHVGMECALGTRAALAAYAIWREFPELRPAMELARPNKFALYPHVSERNPKERK
jgi:hypothetical protein